MEDETNVRLLRDDNADDIEGNGGVSYGSPSFVSQSEALQYQMARVEVKVDQLHEMHLKHLRRPTLDEESQEESNIKRLTNEITQVSIRDRSRFFVLVCRRACGHGDWSPPSFGSHLNPFLTMGKDYAHHILMSPPSFESHRHV